MRSITFRSCIPVFFLAVLIGGPMAAAPKPPDPPDPPDPPENEPPFVKILKPSAGFTVGYGGFNIVDLAATASDVEDGVKCCKVLWTDNGVSIGQSKTLQYTFKSPGQRVLKFKATDSKGLSSTVQVTVTVTNSPPTPSIKQLQPNGGNVYVNVPAIFRGTASDFNELFFPCASLTWTINNVNKGSGCEKSFTPTSPGSQTIKLTATDAQAVAVAKTVTVQAVNPPAGPPVVVIETPLSEWRVDPGQLLPLKGFALDPEGKSPLTYKWTVQPVSGGSAPKTLGTALSLSWTPSTDVVFHCGGRSVKLCLSATDPDNLTGTSCIEFVVGFPPC